jgi:hypothetical protein
MDVPVLVGHRLQGAHDRRADRDQPAGALVDAARRVRGDGVALGIRPLAAFQR